MSNRKSVTNNGLLQHPRADKYVTQCNIELGLRAFVEKVEKELEIHPNLLKLVARGVQEHLKGGKAWQVKVGSKSLSLSFLAAYKLAKEKHTNQVIADYLNISLEAAKGFKKKIDNITSDEKEAFNFYLTSHKSMMKNSFSILEILKIDYGG